MTVITLCSSALAAGDEKNITYYEDGSYRITYITYDEQQDGISPQATTKVISGTKTDEYYTNSNKLAWTFSVKGTFNYDGRSAKATASDYSYKIYDRSWSFVSGSSSYSGATATATGKFSWYGVSTNASVSLTCSANGVLS